MYVVNDWNGGKKMNDELFTLEEFKEAIDRARASKNDILWECDIEVFEHYYQKQVPMKAIAKYDKEHDYTSYNCANCKNHCYFTKNYCDCCGQKLDWGKDDESKFM